MLLSSELVQTLERAVRDEEGYTRIIYYGLFRDETSARNGFHYIKCHMEVWRGQQLIYEDADVAGGLGSDDALARRVFNRLTEVADPVFPANLGDVVRDQVIMADPVWLARQTSLASRDSA